MACDYLLLLMTTSLVFAKTANRSIHCSCVVSDVGQFMSGNSPGSKVSMSSLSIHAPTLWSTRLSAFMQCRGG